MLTSTLTAKGQVTIPASVRRSLGLRQGDRIGFITEGDRVVLLPVVMEIDAAFGLVQPARSVGLEEMETVPRKQERP